MRYNTIILIMSFGAALLFAAEVGAQDRSEMSHGEQYRADSLENEAVQEEREQKNKDEARMADIKHNKKQTKAKAKEAQRVEREASSAARESRYALRAEKRAQKARKQADKQAEKASKAIEKSERN